MGHQIIKQPDGRLAVFSSIVDDWILFDASQQELEDYYAERAANDARKSAREAIEHVLAGEPRKVYYQFAMTFKQADRIAQHKLADLQAAGELYGESNAQAAE